MILVLFLPHPHKHQVGIVSDRRRGSVVFASEFKSEDPEFDLLAGQGEGQFFCPSESTLVQIRLCLTPLRDYRTHPNLCAR